jgi:hypothetical protein
VIYYRHQTESAREFSHGHLIAISHKNCLSKGCIFFQYIVLYIISGPWIGTFKVVPWAWLIKHYTMKVYEGVDVWIHVFLTSALDGGDWSASRPGRFIPGERPPFTHWIGGAPEPVWTTWRGEKSYPYRDWNSDPPLGRPTAVSRLYSEWL